jgi:hypothetical protein
MWQFQKILSLKSGEFGTLFSQNIPFYELALHLVCCFWWPSGENLPPQKKIKSTIN